MQTPNEVDRLRNTWLNPPDEDHWPDQLLVEDLAHLPSYTYTLTPTELIRSDGVVIPLKRYE